MIPIQCPAGSPRKKGLLREVGEEEGERPPPSGKGPRGMQGGARAHSSGSWEA